MNIVNLIEALTEIVAQTPEETPMVLSLGRESKVGSKFTLTLPIEELEGIIRETAQTLKVLAQARLVELNEKIEKIDVDYPACVLPDPVEEEPIDPPVEPTDPEEPIDPPVEEEEEPIDPEEP